MLLMAMTWPEASVRMTLIAAVAVVLSVLIWSIFRTGQTAIKKEIRQQREIDGQSERPRAEARGL